jgi:hypothetical protein
VAGGGSTEATASGEVAVAAETEEKKNTMTTVLGIYRAIKMTLGQRVARREHAEARAGGRTRAWKAFKARRRRREVAPCGWR